MQQLRQYPEQQQQQQWWQPGRRRPRSRALYSYGLQLRAAAALYRFSCTTCAVLTACDVPLLAVPLALYRLRCNDYAVPLPMYRVRCTGYAVPIRLYRLRFTTSGVPIKVYRSRYAAYAMPLTLYRIRCTAYGAPPTLYRIRSTSTAYSYALQLHSNAALYSYSCALTRISTAILQTYVLQLRYRWDITSPLQ